METAKPPFERATLSSSLPTYLTTFVGRKQERATLCSLLLSKRFLTLVGAGGMGKTRLAIQVASELAASFRDGMFLIELASLTEPALVLQATASAFRIGTSEDSSLLTLLISALRECHGLLIFDNCEHVLEACTSLIESLLEACPSLHILATSREPLHSVQETIWPVATLSFPHPEHMPPFEQLGYCEAIQLFCERAAESDPRFCFTAQNAPAIVRICYLLDGLPLALELAAARLSLLSVDQIAARLDERFMLLTDGERTAASRQQTLRATLDWSYVLLTSVEQALFLRLAIFAGSWNAEAVEQVIDPALIQPYSSSDILAHLVNKSLVIAEEQEGQKEEPGEIRYRLLSTVRQYAQGKLKELGAWLQMCERHHAWYLQLAEEASTHLHSADQPVWLSLLEAEMPDIRVALTRSVAMGQVDSAARLAEAVSRFWIIRNHFSEGRYWFETILTAARDNNQLSSSLRARILFGASEFARYQGANERACTLLEEQIVLLQMLDDPVRLAEAQVYLGMALGLRGEYERAHQLCQTSLAFYRERKQTGGIAKTLIALSFMALSQRKYHYAITLGEEACQVLREAGDYAYLLYALLSLIQANILQRRLEQARTACKEALHLAQLLHQSFGLAACFGLIAGIAGLQGQPIQAARLFGAAQALQKQINAPLPPSGQALQEQMVFSVRSTLGKEQFLIHYSAGQSSTLEQMLTEAEAVLQTPPPAALDAQGLPSSASSSATSSTVPSELASLSQRQREVLALVATGLTNAQVAQRLQLSPNTISKHLQSIYTRLNINSRSAATRIALEHGLI